MGISLLQAKSEDDGDGIHLVDLSCKVRPSSSVVVLFPFYTILVDFIVLLLFGISRGCPNPLCLPCTLDFLYMIIPHSFVDPDIIFIGCSSPTPF